MPTYSYRCTECDRAFDIVQAFTDDSLTVCPTCGGKLRKVFSPVGITFNGSGFYRTDSRAGASSSVPKSDSSGSSSTSESSSSSSAPAAEKSAPRKDAAKPATSTGSSSGSTSN